MRILVAVNKPPHHDSAVNLVADLAKNTWADVTLLGTAANASMAEAKKKISTGRPDVNMDVAVALDGYRSRFLRQIRDKDTPYNGLESEFRLGLDGRNRMALEYKGQNGRKSLNAHIRSGDAAREILTESVEEDTDLILLTCTNPDPEPVAISRKIAKNARCSVFIIKEEEEKPKRIVCCLDKDRVTQASLELVNQLVTLYNAELEIVGLKTGENLPSDVDHKMAEILNYYHDRHIKAWIKLVEPGHLKSFLSSAGKNCLVALWMGEKSFLDKFYSKKLLENFVETTESSVLILR